MLIHNFMSKNIIVIFIIKKLKSKHTSLKIIQSETNYKLVPLWVFFEGTRGFIFHIFQAYEGL